MDLLDAKNARSAKGQKVQQELVLKLKTNEEKNTTVCPYAHNTNPYSIWGVSRSLRLSGIRLG
jgi:hypothetical protein